MATCTSVSVLRSIQKQISSSRAFSSLWTNVTMGPPDPILSINEAYKRDKNPNKVNLAFGTYRDNDGNPFVLPTVREAEERIMAKKLDKEYAPIDGIPEFCRLSLSLALGRRNELWKNRLNATLQGISGTGSIRLGAAFLSNFYPGNKQVYLPSPTWFNHAPILKHAGLAVNEYRYLNKKFRGFDFEGAIEDIKKIPAKSIILFQACAHNPTGSDPTRDQWVEIATVVKKGELFPFFDMAFHGLATGDLPKDAFAVRHFVNEGHEIALSQSYSNNMGLYGERPGAFSLITTNQEHAEKALSQLRIIARAMYSNPPIHGARIVTEILSDPLLKAKWVEDLSCMSKRIVQMRKELCGHLEKAGSVRDWSHLTKQVGMFCYTGLTEDQCERIRKLYSIYMTQEGRISVATITPSNVEYIARSMHEVTK